VLLLLLLLLLLLHCILKLPLQVEYLRSVIISLLLQKMLQSIVSCLLFINQPLIKSILHILYSPQYSGISDPLHLILI
jgi:hypothetical protein